MTDPFLFFVGVGKMMREGRRSVEFFKELLEFCYEGYKPLEKRVIESKRKEMENKSKEKLTI